MNNTQTPARSIALFILLVTTAATGLALVFSLFGNYSLSLMVCGGGLILNIGILIFGGLAVASSRPEENE